jgi:hypothetical protein
MLHAYPQQCAALQVTHVVSQSDVVKLLWANKQVLGDAFPTLWSSWSWMA